MPQPFPKTVFVVGAGASVPYNYPTGNTLRSELIGAPPATLEELTATSSKTKTSHAQYRAAFSTALKRSMLGSVDEFLEQQPVMSPYGKYAIAHSLLPRERDIIRRDLVCDDWMAWLFRLISRQPYLIDEDLVSFVTFNYDHVLEVGFYQGFRYSRGLSHDQALERARKVPIFHVYGSLNYELERLLSDSTSADGYFHDKIPVLAKEAASGIRVIAEERASQPSPTIAAARDRIQNARRIVFLGFGFDRLNLERIGALQVCPAFGAHAKPEVYASVFGLRDSERRLVMRLLGGTSPAIRLGGIKDDCLAFLREHCANWLTD